MKGEVCFYVKSNRIACIGTWARRNNGIEPHGTREIMTSPAHNCCCSPALPFQLQEHLVETHTVPQPLPTWGSWAPAMWLVRIQMCCKCRVHTGFQRYKVYGKGNVKMSQYILYEVWANLMIFWICWVKYVTINITRFFLLFGERLVENFKLYMWFMSVAHNLLP